MCSHSIYVLLLSDYRLYAIYLQVYIFNNKKKNWAATDFDSLRLTARYCQINQYEYCI